MTPSSANPPSANPPSAKPQVDHSKTQTHSYDGKLSVTKLQLLEDISRASKIPKANKLNYFGHLRLELQKYTLPQPAQGCFEAIFRTFSQQGRVRTGANYDPTNDLHADDLLYLCFEKIVTYQDKDFTQVFILQLTDMASGLCAQGRTTRLFQILLAFQ